MKGIAGNANQLLSHVFAALRETDTFMYSTSQIVKSETQTCDGILRWLR